MPLPRRILFVTESFGIGGTEKHLLELLPTLKAKGFDVGAFCFTEPGSRAGKLQAIGIEVEAAPGDHTAVHKRSLLARLSIAGGAIALHRLIKRWRPDIVHFFLPRPYLVGAAVAIAAGVPIKIMSRRSLSNYQLKWRGSAAIERRLHRHMDAVIGNSRAVVEELIAKEGCPPSQTHLIYNGVRYPPKLTQAEARAALGLDQRALVAVVLANLYPYKGHLDLVAALADIARQLPQPWTVLCVGRDSGNGPEIARAVTKAGLEDNVRLLGERTDIDLLLSAADLGVLPSHQEGFSNAILESMAHGLPTIVTNVGGNAEAVIDGVTGLVVPPHDPGLLGAAILKLAHDPQLRQSMGEQARVRIAEHFSFDASVEKYCELYERLLARAKPLERRSEA